MYEATIFLLFSVKNGLTLVGCQALDNEWQCLYFVSASVVYISAFYFFSLETLNFFYEYYYALPHLSFIIHIVGGFAAGQVMRVL